MAKCFFVNGTASWYGPDLTCLPIGTCIHSTCHVPCATRLTCHVSRLRAAPGDPARADHGPAQLHLLPLRDDLQLPAGLPGQPRPQPSPAQSSPCHVCRWWAGPRASARLTARGPAGTCPRVSRSSATSPTTQSTVNTSSQESRA